MKIFPAIDLIDGKVVRLYRGNYDMVKNYQLTPAEQAKAFKAEGATHLHVVDLDGAKQGYACNAETIKKIVQSSDAFVEVGGGIRTREQIESYLNCGVKRVIIGTAAVKDFDFVCRMSEKFGNAIAVQVDASEGKVAINGWREITDLNAFAFCERLKEEAGIKTILFTDIATDGALGGTNLNAFSQLKKISDVDITASGGITTIEEIIALRDMGISAAILGKALYEGKLSLKEAIEKGEADVS